MISIWYKLANSKAMNIGRFWKWIRDLATTYYSIQKRKDGHFCEKFYVKWSLAKHLCSLQYCPYYHNLLIVMNIHLNFYQNKPFLFRKLLRKFRFGIQSGKDGNALHASLPIHAICKLSRAYYGNDMHANGICHHYHHHHWLA